MSVLPELIRIKPKVPKFDLNLKPKNIQTSDSEETKQVFDETRSMKKKIKIIHQEIDVQLDKIQNQFALVQVASNQIEATAKRLINAPNLAYLRQKKYESIAKAAIIHAIRLLYLPQTTKSIFSDLQLSEKHIKKILNIFNRLEPIKVEKQINAFTEEICYKMGLNQKFGEFCRKLLQILQSQNLIDGQHEHVISASLVKIIGDFIFWKKGGINLQLIINIANCCEASVKNFFRKIEPYFTKIEEELKSYYGQHIN